jgi:hypothetical protein
MIVDWKAGGKRGATLLISLQEMVSKAFLDTLSPRSCKILRRFLVQYHVPIDTGVGYPNYLAIQDLIMKNPTLLSTAVLSGTSAEVDVPTSSVTKNNHNIRHETASLLGISDEPVPDLTPHAPMEGDAHTGQDQIRGGGHSNWTSAPALMANPVSVPT